jgi:2-dehydro-3-deoxyphosphooctonate aldolase (KDO 8-P synthase)
MGTASGGQREFASHSFPRSIGHWCAALFIETHEDPDKAPSDGPNMLPISQLPALLKQFRAIDSLIKGR